MIPRSWDQVPHQASCSAGSLLLPLPLPALPPCFCTRAEYMCAYMCVYTHTYIHTCVCVCVSPSLLSLKERKKEKRMSLSLFLSFFLSFILKILLLHLTARKRAQVGRAAEAMRGVYRALHCYFGPCGSDLYYRGGAGTQDSDLRISALYGEPTRGP